MEPKGIQLWSTEHFNQKRALLFNNHTVLRGDCMSRSKKGAIAM